MTQAQFDVLQTFIDEFKNISPETTNAFIFDKNGEIIARNKATTEDQTKNLVSNFKNLTQQAQTIGNVQNLTIQAANGQLNITTMNNLYLASVSSREADQKIVKSLTYVLIPAVVRLVDQITQEPTENQPAQIIESHDEPIEEKVSPVELPEESQNVEPTAQPEPSASFSSEPLLPQPPVNQFMVEKIGGFLVSPDTVRIDGEVLSKWRDLYKDKEIVWVNIETLEGKKTNCKVKPIKEYNAKGIIQVPERILQTLQTGKGKLVMVKPVIF